MVERDEERKGGLVREREIERIRMTNQEKYEEDHTAEE